MPFLSLTGSWMIVQFLCRQTTANTGTDQAEIALWRSEVGGPVTVRKADTGEHRLDVVGA